MNKRQIKKFKISALMLIIIVGMTPFINAYNCANRIKYNTNNKTETVVNNNTEDRLQKYSPSEVYVLYKLGAAIVKTLTKKGYQASMYISNAIEIQTEKYYIVLGHGLEDKQGYTIAGLDKGHIQALAYEHEYTALLACNSQLLQIKANHLLCFPTKVSVIEALESLSNFIGINFVVPEDIANIYLSVGVSLDPGTGGGTGGGSSGDSGDEPDEGWTYMKASITYDGVYYLFDLMTEEGCAALDDFLNCDEHLYLIFDYDFRGHFRYAELSPTITNVVGYITYSDNQLVYLRETGRFRVGLEYVLVDEGDPYDASDDKYDYHKFLYLFDLHYNGEPLKYDSYVVKADADDNTTSAQTIKETIRDKAGNYLFHVIVPLLICLIGTEIALFWFAMKDFLVPIFGTYIAISQILGYAIPIVGIAIGVLLVVAVITSIIYFVF